MSYQKEARTNWVVVVARNYTETMRPITMIVLVMIVLAVVMGLILINADVAQSMLFEWHQNWFWRGVNCQRKSGEIWEGLLRV